jgi:hypothetical protein
VSRAYRDHKPFRFDGTLDKSAHLAAVAQAASSGDFVKGGSSRPRS